MDFNDVRLQYDLLRDEIDAAIASTLNGGRYILGPAVRRFEEAFANYSGAAHGIGVANGTDAISIGLQAIGVRTRDEVLVPAVSAPATAMAVISIGAIPVFVDVSRTDFMMDPKVAFERLTPRVRAIVPVHLYGMPARLKELAEIGVPVLEDAAQAHGSRASWGRCGSFGAAAAFSFYPTKNLGTYGDGGMIVTSSVSLADRCRLLRDYGQRENYASEIIGRNSRLDEIHAAILQVKLKRLDTWNRRRADIATRYRTAFANLPLTMQAETGTCNYHLFVVVTSARDRLKEHLRSLDIPTLVHYPIPLPRQKAFLDFSPARCPNADMVCSRVLSLPIHASMTDSDTERVIEAVQTFFKRPKQTLDE
jgi:dTDP-3-amino-3,4,6-trideoxy-alpha-D-glucose transaminase